LNHHEAMINNHHENLRSKLIRVWDMNSKISADIHDEFKGRGEVERQRKTASSNSQVSWNFLVFVRAFQGFFPHHPDLFRYFLEIVPRYSLPFTVTSSRDYTKFLHLHATRNCPMISSSPSSNHRILRKA
jgi:hypothetical protein